MYYPWADKTVTRMCVEHVDEEEEEMLAGEACMHPGCIQDVTTMSTAGIDAVGGKRNILLVATHGNMRDDMGTTEFTLAIRERLDCFAITNSRFHKGVKTAIEQDIADLYKSEVFLHPSIKGLFWDPLNGFLKEILADHQKALVLHIHGIKDSNILKIAKMMNGDPLNPKHDARLVLGYGQHYKNPRYTADVKNVIAPLIDSFTRKGLMALPAPVDPISNNGHRTWYCGNDRNRMNQYLYNLREYRQRVESLQVELKFTGVRDQQSLPDAATRFAEAVLAVWKS